MKLFPPQATDWHARHAYSHINKKDGLYQSAYQLGNQAQDSAGGG